MITYYNYNEILFTYIKEYNNCTHSNITTITDNNIFNKSVGIKNHNINI